MSDVTYSLARAAVLARARLLKKHMWVLIVAINSSWSECEALDHGRARQA